MLRKSPSTTENAPIATGLKRLALAAVACAFAVTGAAAHELGLAGLLSKKNSEDLPEITVSADKPLAEAPLVLKSGTYYEIEIVADGSQEIALEGPGFFRAIWIDEIVVNDLEIRPFGISSFEFDDEGTMEIGFVAIKPGSYELRVPGTTGEGRRVSITIQ